VAVNTLGWCNKCGRRFSLTELRTGKCPYGDCASDDIYTETVDGKRDKYIGKHFNSNGDRQVHHERQT
jgi:hypothetical protein